MTTMRKIFSPVGAVIVLMFIAANARAKPAITEISGKISSGNTLTVSGGAFFSHADYNPDKEYIVSAWDNMENGIVDTTTFSSASGQEMVTDPALQRNGSRYCGRGYRWTSTHTYTNIFGSTVTTYNMYGATHFETDLPKIIFASGWFMFAEGFSEGINYQAGDLDQTKFLVLDPPSIDYGGGGGPKTYFQTRAGAIVPLRTETEDGYLSESHGALSSWSPEGEWHRFDIYANLDQPEGYKIHEFYVDGKKITRAHEYYNETGAPLRFERIGFLPYQFPGDDTHTWFQYCDDMYVDRTLARVELSETNVWNATEVRHKELQIPLSWTDNEIKFIFNQGSFQNGETVYLFVIDENGSASEPYPITINNDSTPPAPPQSLLFEN